MAERLETDLSDFLQEKSTGNFCARSGQGENPKNKSKHYERSGFFELELLVWTSLILSLFYTAVKIHQHLEKGHEKVIHDFVIEWNDIN